MELDLKSLLTFVFDADITQPSACQSCEDMLYAYIDAELEAEAAVAKFPAIKAHLDECPACQQEYEEMKALLLMERRGALTQPPLEATFDFSYLTTTAAAHSIWSVVQRAGQQATELFSEIRIVLSQGRAFFDQLPSPLASEWYVAPMPTRRSGPEERIPVLSLPSLEHDLSLRLIVIPPGSEEIEATLLVEVTKISSQQPVVRCRVSIRDAKYRLLESHLTREEGRVRFANVQPDSYVVEVKYRRQVLQIPMTLR